MIVRNPWLKASAKVAGDQRLFLRKDFQAAAVAVAVCETAAVHDPEVC
ncbi:hypothetical protein [Streptomyces sp. NRRL S-118]|nr:hypothetical protein [Streptomyces sp. NRRL S-118]